VQPGRRESPKLKDIVLLEDFNDVIEMSVRDFVYGDTASTEPESAAARDNPSDAVTGANAQLESQRGWSGSLPLLSVLLNHMQEVIRR